uniref:Uncharacterized protein n=1 Tax=Panagrolaimus davidi TaxID=227884 RepID=A0A914QLL2_9BILA
MLYSLYTYFAYNQVQMLPIDEKLLFEDEPYLKTKDNDPSTVITTLIIDFIISLLIQCWLFFVVYRCYQYLMAKKKAEKTPTFPSPNFYQYY